MRAFSAPAVAIVYGDQFVDELFFFVAFDGRLVTRRVRFCGFDSVDIAVMLEAIICATTSVLPTYREQTATDRPEL